MVKADTITVSVRYHNMLRHRTGVARENVALPAGSTLHAALAHLAERHGPHLREMLFTPDGSVSSHLVVFHNRKLARQNLAQRPLADGDELLLFPAIAGGNSNDAFPDSPRSAAKGQK